MREYIEEPNQIMLGVRAWSNAPFGPGDPCPTCKRGIKSGDDDIYCARCDAASPRVEAKIRAAKLGVKVKDRAERAREKVKLEARRLAANNLSESTRRRIWNGYRGSIFAEAKATNASKEGRDFLIRINQCPDWSLVLEKRKWGEPMEARPAVQ